jgi:hypothetical protein
MATSPPSQGGGGFRPDAAVRLSMPRGATRIAHEPPWPFLIRAKRQTQAGQGDASTVTPPLPSSRYEATRLNAAQRRSGVMGS